MLNTHQYQIICSMQHLKAVLKNIDQNDLNYLKFNICDILHNRFNNRK